MSAVVLPTSTTRASAYASATASAVAIQLAAATSHGRARASPIDTSSPVVVSTLSGRSPSASSAAASTNATPSRFVRNASDSSAVIVIATAVASPASAATSRSTAASASRSRQTSNGRETVRSVVPSSRAALVFAPPMSTASVAGMRVVGVIDLKAGAAVHAVRGERERYRPIGDPLAIARKFRPGLEELYVADLDAITGAGENDGVIRALAREARVMADAGVSEPERAQALLDLGVHRVVVGTETLADADALDRLLPEAVLSVDLRDGRTLSPDPRLAGLPALDAVARLHRPELREVIVLDLARVGSGAGRTSRRSPRSMPPSPSSSCSRAVACATPGPARTRRRRRGRRARGDRAAPRRQAPLTIVSTCATSARATSAPVASCSPCQPGIPLSSST